MIKTILDSFSNAFAYLFFWFNNIIVKTGAYWYILGVIFATFVVRFLIYPFLKGGVGASDPVKFVDRRPRK